MPGPYEWGQRDYEEGYTDTFLQGDEYDQWRVGYETAKYDSKQQAGQRPYREVYRDEGEDEEYA